MKMNEREDLARAGAMLIAAGVVGLNYLRVRRTEEKKRAKIDQWELESLACIDNYRTTLTAAIEDPNVSSEEFWRRYREETEFLNIITKRPMY